MKNEETAKRLQDAMNKKGITQRELSEKSGVSEASISQYTNGSHAPGNISAKKIGEVLGVDPLWLMGFDIYEHDISMDTQLKRIFDYVQNLTSIGRDTIETIAKTLSEREEERRNNGDV